MFNGGAQFGLDVSNATFKFFYFKFFEPQPYITNNRQI